MSETLAPAAPSAAGKAIKAAYKERAVAVGRLESSPIQLLHRVCQCADNIFYREIGWGALTPRQYAILVTVSHNEGLNQMHLVEKTGIDRSTMSDVLYRMSEKGLLHRQRTMEDLRAYAVKLTKEGWRVLESADPLARLVDEKMLAALPGRQRKKQFIHDLNTLVGVLTNGAP